MVDNTATQAGRKGAAVNGVAVYEVGVGVGGGRAGRHVETKRTGESEVGEAPESGWDGLASPARLVAPAVHTEGGTFTVTLAQIPSTESASVASPLQSPLILSWRGISR